MNVYAKRKQTHRYREQTSGYQRKEGRREGQITGMGFTDKNYVQMDKQQGFIAQGIIVIVL